jgi:O-antigen biosynthesis protein
VIVALPEEGKRVLSILQLSGSPVSFIGFVGVDRQVKTEEYSGYYLGSVSNLKDITSLYGVNEVIFCARDVSSQEIINQMLYLSQLDVEYKIAPPESLFIIGSNSINDQGDLYLVDVNAITTRSNKRNKRLLDVALSLLFLLASPVMLFLVKNFGGYLSNIFNVLSGKKTWVGFVETPDNHASKELRKGVLNPADGPNIGVPDAATSHRLNALYARDYKVSKDIRIVSRSLSKLGR